VPEAKGIRCTMNIRTGSETQYPYPMPKAKKAKKVVVIGGGPGGMEAARVCALRGHEVVLFEKGPKVGGQLLLASVPPNKWRISEGVDYFTAQMQKPNIEVRLKEEANAETVQQLNPDAVIVAAGMKPIFPNIPGLNTARPVLASDVLSGSCEVGENVAIIGGGIVGCETAEFLADKGRKVTVIEMLPRMAMNMLPITRPILLINLSRAKGVVLLAGVQCEQASETGLVITDKKGEKQIIPADTIVIAVGGKPDTGIYDALKGKVPEIFLVGDAVAPRRIIDAIHEGFTAAYSI
jgi:NADPH-dependent 2,4-dienoyl-CoA reductase/sulfur reductase-like enzyme